MTLPLRRKHPTTAPGPSTPARKAAEILGLVWLLLGATAFAQQPPLPSSPRAVECPWSDTKGTPAESTWGSVYLRPPLQTGSVQQTAMQRPPPDARGGEQAAIQDIQIQLEPPSKERLFKLESEHSFRDRLRQEAKSRVPPEQNPLVFPEEAQLGNDPYQGRHWPAMVSTTEPYWVAYNRLLFEQKNFERYGWELGPLGAIISPAVFFKDVAFLPYHVFTDPCRLYEYNTGYCLPGDPVPLLLYPPEISLTGATAQVGAVLLVLAIFP